MRDSKAVGRKAEWTLFPILPISRSPCRGSCICSCIGRMFTAGSSSPLVQPGQALRVLLWNGMRCLAHPIITLSPSKPCTISQITSAESHPQETAVHQSLSYVFHILLWVTQIKSSEGTMPAQCASPKTQLFFVMIKNREKTPLKQTHQCSELQVETTDMSKLQPGRPKLYRHTPVNGQPGASCPAA